MITDPLFYVAAVPAVLVVGVAKAGFGSGMGMLGVLLLTLVVPPVQAAAVMLPILCLMDPLSVWGYRRSWDRKCTAVLLTGGLVGIVAGTLSFHLLDDRLIRLMIGLLTMIFLADFVFGRGRTERRARPGPVAGATLGALAGFTSFVIHAGSPPTAMYLLPQRLDKSVYVGTTIVFFFAVNYLKLVPYAGLGLFSAENLTTSLALMPVAPIGVWTGIRLNRLIPTELFYRLCYVFLFVTGSKLLYDGAAPFFA